MHADARGGAGDSSGASRYVCRRPRARLLYCQSPSRCCVPVASITGGMEIGCMFGGGVRTKRSLNPIWRYTTSVGARRTDPSRGGPSSSNHLSCFACFTCRPISAIRRQRPRSSLALALILGGRLTRLAVFAPYSPFSQLTLSTPHARHATLTSHHDASPVITPTTTITTTSRPSHSPNIPRAPCPP